MRAFIVPDFGAPGSIADVPAPTPEEGQLLVRVKAAAVNAVDPVLATGAFKDWMPHHLPLILGSDYAGTVEAVGPGVTGFAVGDEVFGNTMRMVVGEGTFAELTTATAAAAAHRPATLSVEVAAALPLAGGTAIAELDAAGLAAGDTVLISGTTGGVGSIAVQLAVRRGIRVIAIAGPGKTDAVRALGATDVLERGAPDLDARIRSLAPDGVPAYIDNGADGPGLVPLAAHVRPGGRVVSPFGMGGEQALAHLPVTFHQVQAARDRAGELGAAVVNGDLTVQVETLPLEQAGDALARQMARQVQGKLVLTVA